MVLGTIMVDHGQQWSTVVNHGHHRKPCLNHCNPCSSMVDHDQSWFSAYFIMFDHGHNFVHVWPWSTMVWRLWDLPLRSHCTPHFTIMPMSAILKPLQLFSASLERVIVPVCILGCRFWYFTPKVPWLTMASNGHDDYDWHMLLSMVDLGRPCFWAMSPLLSMVDHGHNNHGWLCFWEMASLSSMVDHGHDDHGWPCFLGVVP